jgi:ribonuclease HI
LKAKVNVYVRVRQQPLSYHGDAIVIFESKGKIKEMRFTSLETTPNRSIILASAIALETLRKPCVVNLYVQSNVGFKYMLSKTKTNWCNRDVGNLLMDITKKNQHELHFIDCSATIKGKTIQNKLAYKIKDS